MVSRRALRALPGTGVGGRCSPWRRGDDRVDAAVSASVGAGSSLAGVSVGGSSVGGVVGAGVAAAGGVVGAGSRFSDSGVGLRWGTAEMGAGATGSGSDCPRLGAGSTVRGAGGSVFGDGAGVGGLAGGAGFCGAGVGSDTGLTRGMTRGMTRVASGSCDDGCRRAASCGGSAAGRGGCGPDSGCAPPGLSAGSPPAASIWANNSRTVSLRPPRLRGAASPRSGSRSTSSVGSDSRRPMSSVGSDRRRPASSGRPSPSRRRRPPPGSSDPRVWSSLTHVPLALHCPLSVGTRHLRDGAPRMIVLISPVTPGQPRACMVIRPS